MSAIESRECPCCGRHDESEEVFDGDQPPCGCPCWWSVDAESASISGPDGRCSTCDAKALDAKDARIAELEAEREGHQCAHRRRAEDRAKRIAELEAEVARLNVNGFGTSVEDSHELLKLRELLDDVGVWPSEKAEQDGDYEACVRHMAERISHTASRIAELEAKLSVSGHESCHAVLHELNRKTNELEAKLAALTVRQPMETAPRDGTAIRMALDEEVSVVVRWRRGEWGAEWREDDTEREFTDGLGWYALPEEVSR